MSTTIEDVLDAALGLPDEERIELVEALITSLEQPGSPPFDDESWRPFIRRRLEELTTGATRSIPWSEVKRRAREAAGG